MFTTVVTLGFYTLLAVFFVAEVFAGAMDVVDA